MEKEVKDKLVKVKADVADKHQIHKNYPIGEVFTEKQRWISLRLSYLDSLCMIDRERDDIFCGDSIQKLIEKLNAELIER